MGKGRGKSFSEVMKEVNATAHLKVVSQGKVSQSDIAVQRARDEIGGESFVSTRKTVERLEEAKERIRRSLSYLENQRRGRLIGYGSLPIVKERIFLKKELNKIQKALIDAKTRYSNKLRYLESQQIKKKIEKRAKEILIERSKKPLPVFFRTPSRIRELKVVRKRPGINRER